MFKILTFVTLIALQTVFPVASQAQEVVSGKGRPLNFDLGYGTMTNPGSTLSQKWYLVNDPNIPVTISERGHLGLEVVLLDRGYIYRTAMNLKVEAPIVAVEVVVIPFDVWNKPGRPLSLTHIADMLPGSISVDGQWNAYSEVTALSLLTSFAYVDQVRLVDGTVLRADRAFVLDEARKISSGLEEEDIAPASTAD